MRSDAYEVQAGDTLWDIADEQLGDPTGWSDIWDANAGRVMSDGRVFEDPNLIVPGWKLDLRVPTPAVEPSGERAPTTPDLDRFDVSPDEGASTGAPPTATPADADDDPASLASPAPESTVSPPTVPAVTASTVAPTTTAPTASAPATSTTTSTPSAVEPPTGASDEGRQQPAPAGPSPIRIEHAALLAAGVLALVGVRRQRRLRAAMPRHRVPEPRPEVVDTERRLRIVDAGERALRVDVSCRAAAWSLIDAHAEIGWVEVSKDGDVALRLTAPATLPRPWIGDGQHWVLGAEVPIELLSEDARQVAMPCIAMVQIGVTPSGSDVLVDLEACGVLAVEAVDPQADEVITAIAAGLASSTSAEVAHLIGVALPRAALLGHRNAHQVESPDAAFELAAALVGTTVTNERTSFELRSLRTGGEAWEPAVILLTSVDGVRSEDLGSRAIEPGHGFGVVVASADQGSGASTTLRADPEGWSLHGFGSRIELTPIGLSSDDLAVVDAVLADAEQPLEVIDIANEVTWAD
ncbi:MAG: LysM peptidoglycan-binding domain-containing protein, partial [Ilumatobacteraceae bacterium]